MAGAVEVVIRDRLVLPKPPVKLADALREAFTYKNPDVARNNRMGIWARAPKRVQNYDELEDGGLSLPRGGATKVCDVARQEGYCLAWLDERREAPCQGMPTYAEAEALLANEGIFPTPRQVELADGLVAKENAYVRAITSSGKTVLIGLAIVKAGQRALYLVPTSGLRDQAVGEFSSLVGARAVGKLSSTTDEFRPIMVTTYQALCAIKRAGTDFADHVRAAFGTIVADELHLAGADSWLEAVEWMPARYRWGASSDERRTDRKEFLIYDAFGKMADSITLDEAI